MKRLLVLSLCAIAGCTGANLANRPVGSALSPQQPKRPAPAVVSVALRGPTTFRGDVLSLMFRLGGIPLEQISEIELWQSADHGQSWDMAMRTTPPASRFRVPVSEGTWSFRIALVGQTGRLSAPPRPGDPAQLTVLVDRTPPAITIDAIRVSRVTGSPFPPTDGFRVGLQYTVTDDNPDTPACIVSLTGAKKAHWHTVGRGAAPRGVVTFTAAEFLSPLHIRLKATDVAGNITAAESTIWPEDEVDPPSLAIQSPVENSFLRAGDTVVILYDIRWQNLADDAVSISYTSDGEAWHSLARNVPNTGSWTWQVPAVDIAEAFLRLEARGRSGRKLTETAGPIRIDATPPVGTILGPRSFPTRQGALAVSTADPGPVSAGIKRVAVYAQGASNAEPEEIARVTDSFDHVPIELPGPGLYHLWIVAWDRAGNASSDPPHGEPFSLRVDPPAAQIRLTTLIAGGIIRQGSTHILAWEINEVADPFKTGRILLVGEEETTILATVDPYAKRAMVTFPDTVVRDARLRLELTSAGGRLLRAETGSFSSDNRIPSVRLVSGTVNGDHVSLTYEAADEGPADLGHVWLFTTPDGGRTWPKQQPLDLSGSAMVMPGDGVWGFYLAAEDAVGNHTPFPHEGHEPMLTLLVGSIPENALALETFTGGERVRGGTTHYVFWRCTVVPTAVRENTAALLLSADGGTSYTPVAVGLPATGRYAVAMPERDGARIRFRVTLQTTVGRTLTAESVSDIRIDSRAPSFFVVGPPASRHAEVTLKMEWLDDEPDDMIEIFLYARRRPDGTWEELPHKLERKTPRVTLADGQWEIFAGGTDAVGNQTPPPHQATRGTLVLVDTVPPILKVDRNPADRAVLAGSVVTFTCHVRDRFPDPLSLTMSTKRRQPGATWKRERGFLSPDTPIDLELHDREGRLDVLFAVHDLAGNRATWRDTIVVRVPPPIVSISLPENDSFPGGIAVPLTWKTDAAGPDAKVVIALSVDGRRSWQTLADDLPPRGETELPLPPADSRAAYLRATVTTALGKTAEAVTGPFTISTAQPEAAVVGTVLKP